MNKTNSSTHKNMYLSLEEQNRYIAIAQGKTNAGDREIREAKGILFENNRGFITACAVEFARVFTNNVVDKDDFLSDAYLGFQNAVEKFDPAFGCALLTYAKRWIYQAMQRGSERFAYCTSSSSGDRAKFRKGLRLQEQGLTRDEISGEIGVDWAELENMGRGRSLQESYYWDYDSDSMELGDGIADPANETAEEIDARLDYESRLESIRKALPNLSKENAWLIQAYYGIGMRKHTLAELCEPAGVKTPSAVKKQIDRAIAEIRVTAVSYMNLPLAG